MADDGDKPEGVDTRPGRAKRVRRRKSTPVPLALAVGAVAAVLAGVGLYLSFGGKPTPAGGRAERTGAPGALEAEAVAADESRAEPDEEAPVRRAGPERAPRTEETEKPGEAGGRPSRVIQTAASSGPGRDGPAGGANPEPVRYVRPGPAWDRFLVLVWQYKTDVRQDLPLYRRVNIRGFHIDRGAGREALVAFAKDNDLPYYVDHAADKGILHLTSRTGKDGILRKRTVVARPHSLAEAKTVDLLKSHLRKNIQTTKRGPVVAYAFDDEISIGVFNSPVEVDGSPQSVGGYRRWLQKTYGTIDRLNRTWNTEYRDFSEVGPVSFEEVRRAHTSPPLLHVPARRQTGWNLARWMDWRSYMDSQFADCLATLTRYANTLDSRTPAGFVGGQQPAPYGGYDYSKICKAVQWIESYDIGGTCEILRSLWGVGPERRPYVLTWFSPGEAKRDAWFLWYYLLHGSRAVIAWPDRDGSWFHHKDGGIADFILENAGTIREVQGDVSKAILDLDVRFDADPIALYYSHPSVQATWVMDAATHGSSWPNRSSGLDNRCQSAGKNRVAWFKLLEDCGFQYNVVTPEQVARGELVRKKYKVLVLDRVAAMSDAEAEAVRAFVRKGGTVIADHLTAVLTEHGVGRHERGALDTMFGITRDESEGYLDGRHITEIDGELYEKPFLERLKYDGALRHEGIVVYERGTRAASSLPVPDRQTGGQRRGPDRAASSGQRRGPDRAEAGRPEATVGGASVVIRNRFGRGRTVYLNLTPMAYFDMNARLGGYGEAWRKLLSRLLAESGLEPRARAFSGGRPVLMSEFVYWRKGRKLVVGLVKNPTRQGSITGAGQIHGVTGGPTDVEIVFRERVKGAVNLRTGEKLPAGSTICARWKPWEALLFEVTLP